MLPSAFQTHPTTESMSRSTRMTAPPPRPRRRSFAAPLLAAAFLLAPAAASAQANPNVWINEVNYDTPGVDDITSDERIEFVEIVAPAGFNTAGWAIVIYDGADGTVFQQRDFPENEPGSTIFPNQNNGFGVLAIRISQPDGVGGIALVDDQDNVVQFLSYEGAFTATGGPADGMTSVQIPLSDPDQPAGATDLSLQLAGAGRTYGDFTWTNDRAVTSNAFNTGQSISNPVSVEGGAESGSSLALYPNPSSGRVSVDLSVDAPGYARVSVYDALGREVAVLHDGPVSGLTQAAIGAGDLAPGVYVVRAVTPGFALTRTLSVAR